MGSCAEYGDRKDFMSETMYLEPVSIYGSTKACSTILAHQIAKENNISIATIRPFGVFGEAEERHKVFCHIILTALEGKDVPLTLCEQYRDYCYVENIIDALILAAKSSAVKSEIFNAGSGVSYPLKHYVNLIFKYLDIDRKPIYGAVPYRKNEIWGPKPDISKVKSMLHWKPRIDLEQGIKRTVQWFKVNMHEYAMLDGVIK
jgi:nucleoside-diphosphate-sugar epimerase